MIARSILFLVLIFSCELGANSLDSLLGELESYKGEDSLKVKILQNISFQYHRSEPKKGIAFGEKGLILAKKLNWEKGIADCYGSIASNYIAISDYEKAIKNYNSSILIREKIKDSLGLSKDLNNLGESYRRKSEYLEALKYFHKALRISEKLGKKSAIASTLNNLGLIHKSQEDYDTALSFFEKSLKIKKNLKDDRGVASSLGNIGITYFAKEEYEKAIEYYLEALEIFKKLEAKPQIANSLINLGVSSINQGNTSEALVYYRRALKIIDELGNKSGEAMILGNIGGLYYDLAASSKFGRSKNIQLAIQNLKEAISIYEAIGEMDARSNFLKTLADCYKFKKDYKKWGEYLEKYLVIRDSVFSAEKTEAISKLTAQRERIKNENEIALLKEREKTQEFEKQLIIISVLIGALMVGAFVMLILRRLKKERQLANELEVKNSVIERTHFELVEKNEELMSSIRYAEKIQDAILPWDSSLREYLPNYFLIYKPKDIVSGDFYWFKEAEDGFFLAVGDCTGHGVPGSMLMMIGATILDEAVLNQKIKNTGKILDYLNSKMNDILQKKVKENESRDGMDIAIIKIYKKLDEDDNEKTDPSNNFSNFRMKFSGAKRPIFILEPNGEFHSTRGDRRSIAGNKNIGTNLKFETHKFEIKSGTKVFLTSDGMVDQMGENGKKYGTKRLKEFIIENQKKSINVLGDKLLEDFLLHKGNEDQRDDITVLGFEI